MHRQRRLCLLCEWLVIIQTINVAERPRLADLDFIPNENDA
jgi:hypothetical protein